MAISSHDIVPDSPTNTFATLNPLIISTATLSDGNLKAQQTNAEYGLFRSTLSIPKTGKYYVECFILSSVSTGNNQLFGITDSETNKRFLYDFYYTGNGIINSDGVTSTPSTGALVAGQIIAILIDADSGSANFYIDNTILSSPTYSLTSTTDYFVYFNGYSSGVSVYNFGQDHTFGGYPNNLASSSGYPDSAGYGLFYYDPTQIASDVKALCTANLSDPDIDPNVDDLPEDYFKAVKYQASNVNNQIQSVNVGFQPDLIWIKNRDNTETHYLTDTLRSSLTNNRLDKFLCSNETSTETTVSNRVTGTTVTLTSDGYEISDSNMASGELYFGTRQYICWAWKAGGAPSGSTSTTGSAKRINTSGTQDDTSCSALASAATSAGASNVITPTLMSINQKAGFSIVKYVGNGNSGQTVPHGLSSTPELVIAKNLDDAANWLVYHKSLSSNIHYLHLELPNSETSNSAFWSAFSANTFTLGNSNHINGLSDDIIAYCWHSVPGYSAFGSYTANGSADGPFVYTGFKPAWLMIKHISGSVGTTHSSWMIVDNTRDTYNPTTNILWANRSVSEGYRGDGTTALSGNVGYTDFVSNGFKIRDAGSDEINDSSDVYIYACFAQTPFKYSATNAR